MLAGEEEARPIPEAGQPNLPKPSKEETRSAPKCTTEGVGYVLECWPCRFKGKTFKYIGESSRSAYQRGKEHWADIEASKKTHPLTLHNDDFHEGEPLAL